MKHINLNGRKVACPFDDLLRPLTTDEFAELESAIIEQEEILVHLQTYISEKWGESFLDGHHRARIASAQQMEVLIFCRGRMPDDKAREIALKLNIPRRHLTVAERMELKGERVFKVAIRTAEGASTRTIADELGISQVQVRRDQEAGSADSGEPPGSPEFPPAITGRDGKTYTPSRRARVRRISAAVQAYEHATRLQATLKRFLASESNLARASALADERGIPMGEDNRSCPWIGLLVAWFRDLGPGVRV